MQSSAKSSSWWTHWASSLAGARRSTSGAVGSAAHSQQADERIKIRASDRAYLLRNLATLVGHGVSLPKALETLAREKTLRRYVRVLNGLRRDVEMGEGLSKAMARYPGAFGDLVVHQVRVAERAGTLAATLERVATQLETAGQLRWQVIRKLAYPGLLLGAGTLSVTFMLMFVVPVFEETYAESGVPLPWITQCLIQVGRWMAAYGWIGLLLPVIAALSWHRLRQTPAMAERIDGWILRVPLLGGWWRNVIVLEFIEALGNLLESGFTVAESLAITCDTVSNRVIRRSIESLREAVERGERFSSELERLGDLFPPVVTQLVVIAERTGTLAQAAAQIRQHLRREIERQTSLMVGTIEPALTISLAVAIGTIVLAIYLPMFDMIGAVGSA